MTRILITVIIGLLTFGNSNAQYRQNKRHHELKKGKNISLNIKDKKENPQTTYFNLGLLSNFSQLNGVGINLISSINHYYSNGLQLSGFANITGLNANGVQITSIANVIGKEANGLTVGGVMNIGGKSLSGMQIAGLGNITVEHLNGFSVAGLMNLSNKNSAGLHIAGLANISGENTAGVDIAGLMNASGGNANGLQLASLLNLSGNANKGAQIAVLGNISVKNRGLQTSIINYAEDNEGLQLGLSNVASNTRRGLQIGVFNMSNDSCAHQIGLLNINPNTRAQMIVSGGNTDKLKIGVRFKNKYTYNQFGIGGYYLGMDNDMSLSLSYRTGLYYNLSPKWSVSGDMSLYHIEALGCKNDGFPKRMFAVQPSATIEYSILKRCSIFASGGYAWTYSYKHRQKIDNKPYFEIGVALF